jgi:antitoxin YefM
VDIGLRGLKWNGENTMCEIMQKYQKITAEKAARNAEYLAKIDRGIEQLASGRGQLHELIEVDADESTD